MFTALFMICLMSPIVQYMGENCEVAAAKMNFPTLEQCQFYLTQETGYLQTQEGQINLKQRLPLYNENKWKARGVCTVVVVDEWIEEAK